MRFSLELVDSRLTKAKIGVNCCVASSNFFGTHPKDPTLQNSFAGKPASTALLIFLLVVVGSTPVAAQSVFGNDGLAGGARWDAAPRVIEGLERSLDGGLRYSLEGGSYIAFRDSFNWTQVPSEPQFIALVQQAFDAWGATDRVSGFASSLTFVHDPITTVDRNLLSGGSMATAAPGVRLGSEIDLFARDLGASFPRAQATFSTVLGPVQLTSGTTNYSAKAISGADIFINANAEVYYTPDVFRRLLTHEIGHALGFDDVDRSSSYIDDNYDGSSATTAVATLTNNWAHRVDPLDPSASQGLSTFDLSSAIFGFWLAGIDILMESQGLGVGASNPIENLTPLTNADYSIRQFLYPSLVPVDLEPILGDVNQDGVVNFLDIAPLIAVLTVGSFLEEADCNQDGEVNFLDIEAFIGILTAR